MHKAGSHLRPASKWLPTHSSVHQIESYQMEVRKMISCRRRPQPYLTIDMTLAIYRN
jgi:hypothetical protein